MTILGPVLIGGFLSAAIWLGMKDDMVNHVLVSDVGGLFKDKFEKSEKIDFKYEHREVPVTEFRKKEWDDYNLLLLIPSDPLKTRNVVLYYKNKPSSRVESYIANQVNRSIEKLKVEDAKIDMNIYELIKDTNIQLNMVDVEKIDETKSPLLSVLGFFLAIFIYLFIFLYGAQVMRGVIEEKTSRVVEVIVSSVKPFQLMMGKIIGIALVGLTQFLVWIGLMFIIFFVIQNVMFADQYDPAIQAAQGVAPMAHMANNSELFTLLFHQINYPVVIGCFIFYFLGGYLLYASLFAAVGAVVDSEADSQQFMLPISVPLVFAYIISAMGIDNPEGSAQVWSSFVPFTSPVSMMVRVATGTVPFWQVAVSMTLLVGTFFFTVWLGAKLYRTGILMYGKKPTYRELWKWLRYKS
jgi:ABC-2 type transport system permease protein